METSNLYLKYEASEERGNTVYSFQYNGQNIHMYREIDPDTKKDVWYLDFNDFTDALDLSSTAAITIWKRIPIRYKTLQLYGAHGTDYDQREAVNLDCWEYIFNTDTEGIPELDQIKKHMEVLHIVPKSEKKEPVKEGATKIKGSFDKLFDEDTLEEFKRMQEIIGMGQITFPSLLEKLACACGESRRQETHKKQTEELYSVPFTKKELHALYLFITRGIMPFLTDPKMLENMNSAGAKIHIKYHESRSGK